MQLAEETVRQQLDKVLASHLFETSESRKLLLRYLVEKSIAGQGDALKEYTIAVDALAKPASYDPKHDATVRIQVGRLRQKLTEYYSSEGASDPLVFSLRKGSYRVDFLPAGAGAPPLPASRWKYAALAASLCAVLASAWALSSRSELSRLQERLRSVEEPWSRDLHDIWRPLLESPRPLVVCVGSPTFANFSTNIFLRVSGTNDWDDVTASSQFNLVKKVFPGATTMPWYSFTGIGEANGAFLVGKLLGPYSGKVAFTRSNLLSFQEMSDSNLVFIGPPKFNSQLSAIPIRQELVMGPHGVRVLHPAPGEAPEYTDSFASGPNFNGTTHALISRVPGLSGNGDILILAGNGSPDTLAASQWVTQPKLARQLCDRLRDQSGQLPRYFQAMLRVDFRNGVPTDSAYVLHRTLSVN